MNAKREIIVLAYIGVFDGNNNWMNGWTNFDPQNASIIKSNFLIPGFIGYLSPHIS